MHGPALDISQLVKVEAGEVQVFRNSCSRQCIEADPHPLQEVGPDPGCSPVLEQFPQSLMSPASDHALSVTHPVTNANALVLARGNQIPMPDDQIDLPLLIRAASLAPESVDADARTVEVVWTSGARVRRSPLFGEPYDEELSLEPGHVRLDRLNDRAPFLKTHRAGDLDAVIGAVVPGSAQIEAGRSGVATILFSDREEAAAVFSDVAKGVLRAVSVGYRVHRYEVEKRDGQPELWRAVDWEPFEISAVPVGADPIAGFRSAEETAPCTVQRSNPSQDQRRDPMHEAVDTPSAPAPSASSLAPPPEATRSDPAADADAIAAQARTEERQRVAAIYAAQDKLGLERSLGDDLVQRGVSLDEARALLIDAAAERADAVETRSQVSTPLGGQDDSETRNEAVANALLHRYAPDLFPLGDAAREYRGLTLLELGREYLDGAGIRVRGLSRDEIASRALQSSSDFPLVLAGVANKTLRQAYEAAPRTFLPFCRQILARDFKTMHRIQLGEAPTLEKVGESGEYRRGSIGESKEAYRVETYGKVVAITRQVLINDDLDAFTRIPALFGTSAANLESDVVWGIFAGNPEMGDGKPLFHADHGNLATAGTTITVDNVGKARAEMARQTGLDGKTVLNIRPSFLIVPSALELKTEQLVAQNLLPARSGDVVPPSIRSLTPIAEPRLDLASDKAWYLAASPSLIDTIEYAYLEGHQGAYIETRNGFDVDGVEIKCRLDFGAKAIDWRGLYKNAGN